MSTLLIRTVLTGFAVVSLLATAGCTILKRAEYPDLSLSFVEDGHGSSFSELEWKPRPGHIGPVPVTLNFHAGIVRPADLESALRLANRGWHYTKNGPTVTVFWNDRNESTVTVVYSHALIERIHVRVNRPGCATADGLFEIDGKRVTLPISRDMLIELFGEPVWK